MPDETSYPSPLTIVLEMLTDPTWKYGLTTEQIDYKALDQIAAYLNMPVDEKTS